jgi:hypothetical protein
MKLYIVFDMTGHELGYVKAGSHNSAEKKAVKLYGKGVTVAYTEI